MSDRDRGGTPINMVRFGFDGPLPQLKALRAGPLTALLENGDLRYVKAGDVEVVRRLYMAVRDRNWDTIEPRFTSYSVDDRGDSFHVNFTAEHVNGDVDFAWSGSIEGTADGTICYVMDGAPRKTFLRNRIGYCVLHPMDLAGTPVDVETPGGTVLGRLPERISPHQPFIDMKSISHAAGPSARFTARFDGELFEMEDQRNWTDASYKTYCTPLRIPYPVRVEPTDRIRQTVTLSLVGQPPIVEISGGDVVDVRIGFEPVGRLPRIGFGAAAGRGPLDAGTVERLRDLKPEHLHLDLDLGTEDWRDRLRRGIDQGHQLATGLQLSVIAAPGEPGFDRLAADLAASPVPIVRLFAFPPVNEPISFPRHDLETSRQIVEAARDALGRAGIATAIGGGTRAYFTELNRADKLPVDQLDVVTYTINPQVHAFDNLSLVETLAAQAATVESARALAGARPLAIGPISLRPRYNPNATGPEPAVALAALPPSVDPRQLSLFGAGWTVGSLHRLAEAGVASMTYFETVGWRGLIERGDGLTRQSLFPSRPGQLFPLFHVFAALAELGEADVLPVRLAKSLAVEALAVRSSDRIVILVASFENNDCVVHMDAQGLADARIKYLDEQTAAVAAGEPDFFAGIDGDPVEAQSGRLMLLLRPFAVARVAATMVRRE